MSELTLIFGLLAQVVKTDQKQSVGDATWWLATLLVIVLLAFAAAGIAIYVFRTRAFKNEATESDIPLTLADVRRLHQSGEIDDDEMERLKKIVTDQATQKLSRTPSQKED